jgi:hypothetical protein
MKGQSEIKALNKRMQMDILKTRSHSSKEISLNSSKNKQRTLMSKDEILRNTFKIIS